MNNHQDTDLLAFDSLHNRLRVTGQLRSHTGLRIGVGRDTDVAAHDLPVMRNAAGRPFIPGSSLKGVLRVHLEALLRGLSPDSNVQQHDLACMVLIAQERCIPDETIKEWRDSKTPHEISDLVLKHSCLACQTFGSTWLASHIAVRDLPVQSDYWFGQFEVRTGVALDRDTATAREGMLYNFEIVPPGTQFQLVIEGDNLTDWQKGLLWLGLQPFVRGEARLGGATSRGLGQVELADLTWQLWENDGTPLNLINFLSDGLPEVVPPTETWKKALQQKLEELLNAQKTA